MTRSALTHLACSACGVQADADELATTCAACGKVLLARYDLDLAAETMTREALRDRPWDAWRYAELLPVFDARRRLSLGEGGTPLLPAPALGSRVGLPRLVVKDEGRNPTGSFKARGLCVAVSRAVELGATAIALPSAGNAASAAAAYAARAGIAAHVIMPADAPAVTIAECIAYGARVALVDGFISDAGRLVRAASAELGWFDVSTLKEPYRAEGKKTMGIELAEQLGWRLPDAILYPTGGGTGIVGMWKAFDELEAMGLIGPERPRMIVVQAEGCAPIVRAFETGADHAEPWAAPATVAAGLRVPAAIGDYLILDAIRRSGGTAVAVSEAALLAGMGTLAAEEGIFVSPEVGAAVAALPLLVDRGALDADDEVVLFATGSGLKHTDLVDAGTSLPVLAPDADVAAIASAMRAPAR
ncbi:MAG TPA: threonine synthase [Candidatus Limnocylindria bacterium]|nr:threonine synthase [Candidatus Limnocylindria bacterium]